MVWITTVILHSIMNQNHYQLISLFTLHEHNSYTCNDLTEILGLGKRSINNYISELNDFLSKNRFHVIQILPNNTFEFNSTTQEIKNIRKKFFSMPDYEYRYSSQERIAIIKLLLFRYNKVTVSSITRTLSVGKATCLADIKATTNDLWQEWQIKLLSGSDGYSLDVNEIYRRDYLIGVFHSFLNMSNNQSGVPGIEMWITKHFNLTEQNKKIYPVLTSWQQKHNLSLEGYQLIQLNWILLVMMDRMKQGNYLTDFPMPNSINIVNIALDLLTKLIGAADLERIMPEVYFLASYLEGIRISIAPQFPLDNVPSNAVIHTFLANISIDLKITIVNDEQLFEQLSNHIKSFFCILERDIPFDKKLLQGLEEEYPKICSAVRNNLYILEQSFHRIYNEGETTFLIMHIVAAVSRLLAEHCAFHILLVCDSGLAISTYIIDKLNYHCKVDSIRTTSSVEFHNYIRTTDTMPNLILSFTPDIETSLPMVIISPELSSHDIACIQEKIYSYRTNEKTLINRQHTYYQELSELSSDNIIRPEYIALDLEADTWIDAIQMSANILLANDKITQSYIDSIIRAVYINGPYFVFWPQVALAHTQPVTSSQNAFAASMIRLKTPVCFGSSNNDPVKYVFTFVSSESKEDCDKMIKLINICASPTLFQKLNNCQTALEAFRLISKEL